jgi:hypothetical protein
MVAWADMEQAISVAPAQKRRAGSRGLLLEYDREHGEGIRGRLRQEPLRPLDQRIADCLGFDSERRLRLLTLKRPFREAACLVRWKAVASGRRGEQSRELIAAVFDRYVHTCIYAPGISPGCCTQCYSCRCYCRSRTAVIA